MRIPEHFPPQPAGRITENFIVNQQNEGGQLGNFRGGWWWSVIDHGTFDFN